MRTEIAIDNTVKKIHFECTPSIVGENEFSSPSLILFDSFDHRVHNDEKTIKEYRYIEYGELWFDDHMITTGARKMEVTKLIRREKSSDDSGYDIIAAKYFDHIRLEMSSPGLFMEIIIALPDGSGSAYLALTGEHCEITDISSEITGITVGEGDIPRIAKSISFIDHMEADINNIQIDSTRSASTEGVEIAGRFRLAFHTMSLPGSTLIWHCPYVVLFTFDDGHVEGKNYRELSLIKLNGENSDADSSVQSKFNMKKRDDFPGWEVWKEENRRGMQCEVLFERKGRTVIVKTQNLGIEIECSISTEDKVKVYAALTGDQVALTDIRLM